MKVASTVLRGLLLSNEGRVLDYWGKSKNGKFWRLKYMSRRDRFTAKLKGLREFLWNNLSTKCTKIVLETVVRVIRGWINYHNISDNSHRVEAFRKHSMRTIFRWINRKGRKYPMRWNRFNRILEVMNFPKAGKVISMF